MMNKLIRFMMIAVIASISQADMSQAAVDCAGKPTLNDCHNHCGDNVQCHKDHCTDCPDFDATAFCGYIKTPNPVCVALYQELKRLEREKFERENPNRAREFNEDEM